MLFDGLTVVANPRRILSEPSFRAFVSPIVDERGTFGEGQDLEALIMEVGNVARSKVASRSTVSIRYTRARNIPLIEKQVVLFLC